MQLVFAAVIVLGIFVGNYFWYDMADSEHSAVQGEVTALEGKIKRLEDIIGKVNDIEKRQTKLKQKLDVIDKLRKQKTGPVRMLDSLASIIPKEVWLTSLEEKSGRLSIVGQAKSNDDLATFIFQLNASPYFDISLKQSVKTAAPDKDGEVVGFQLEGNADYSAG